MSDTWNLDLDGRLRGMMQNHDMQAIVAMSPENFTYLTGREIATITVIRQRQSFALIPLNGEPLLILCTVEKIGDHKAGRIGQHRFYTEYLDHPIDSLSRSLEERGLSSATIGIEADYLPFGSYQRLAGNLPQLKLIDAGPALSAIRAAKADHEIAALRHATQCAHRAILEGMQASRLGDTERAMATRIVDGLFQQGATGLLFLVFASGERARVPHASPSARVPLESEIIRFDIGGKFGEFSSDIARTYSTGNPTDDQIETYRALRQIQSTLIDALRPGLAGEDIFYLARDEFNRLGLPFRVPHVGHNCGLELHESPMLRPGEKARIDRGMTINVEPVAFDSQGVFYHLEDLVEVTDSGGRLMSLGLAPSEIPVMGAAVSASNDGGTL